MHALPAPTGDWSIHNTEVTGDRAYSSWCTNGVLALDLEPLDEGEDPELVGQFVPPPAPSHAGFPDVTDVWGVSIREADTVIFVSDMNSGLWIVRPTGDAAPSEDEERDD